MFENIVSNIICTEYDKVLGRKAFQNKLWGTDPARAMVIKFSLSLNYDVEEGYRHLTLVLYGFGYKYIGVFAQIDWNVIRNEWSKDGTTLKKGKSYIKGETPWVLCAYHDSCWRDGVNNLLWNMQERINSIDYLFTSDGWYTIKVLDDSDKAALSEAKKVWEEREKNVGVQDLEFQFEAKKGRKRD
jgi:hypothetical protein